MIDEEQLAASSPYEVSTYLQVHGWSPVFQDAGGTAWAPSTDDVDDSHELWVPRTGRMRGYRNRVARILDILGDVEGRSPAQILFEINHALQDVQRIRTLPSSEAGTVGLEDGHETLSGIHKWVASGAAAAASSSPSALLPSRRPVIAENFMSLVKLAAPEEGSFIWKVTVPLTDSGGGHALPFPNLTTRSQFSTFNRTVTRTLHDATAAVLRACKSVEAGEDLLSTFQAGIESGVTANLCEGLAETGGESRNPYEVSFVWSTSLPAPPTETLRFGSGELEIVKQAAVEFRRVAPEPDVQLRGYIVRLNRESEQRPGIVTVAGTIVGDSQEKFGHFGFELTSEDYAIALASHGEHQLVTVAGDMVRRGTRKWLENVRGFTVLNEAPHD